VYSEVCDANVYWYVMCIYFILLCLIETSRREMPLYDECEAFQVPCEMLSKNEGMILPPINH